jgi:hypothetical protein
MMIPGMPPEAIAFAPTPIILPAVMQHTRPSKKKIRFTKEQDDLIKQLVEEDPRPSWADIAVQIPGKTAKQCRERFQHFLAPNLQRDPWSLFDDVRLIQWHHFYGSDWAAIAKHFPGRTNNDVKNRFNSHLKEAEMDTFLAYMGSQVRSLDLARN